jgi:hypothetical protein
MISDKVDLCMGGWRNWCGGLTVYFFEPQRKKLRSRRQAETFAEAARYGARLPKGSLIRISAPSGAEAIRGHGQRKER